MDFHDTFTWHELPLTELEVVLHLQFLFPAIQKREPGSHIRHSDQTTDWPSEKTYYDFGQKQEIYFAKLPVQPWETAILPSNLYLWHICAVVRRPKREAGHAHLIPSS
jgi:hypothetical protein